MRATRVWTGLLTRLTIGLGVAVAASLSWLAISYGELDPSSLWAIEANCIAVKKSTGLAFPCADVGLPTSDDIGWVLLKSPKSPTEFLLSPAEPVRGLEDVLAGEGRAAALWRRAWDERSRIGLVLGSPADWGDIGLAVNSATTRTQDQFHIHIECVATRTRATLAALTLPKPAVWQSGLRLGRASYWMRVLDAEEPDGTNLVQLVREIPGAPGSLKRAGVALLGVTTAGKKRSLLLVVNFQDVAAEDLLDHTCAGVKRPD